MQGLFEAINLDELSVDASDLSQASRVLGLLSQYAQQKSAAMRFRAAGKIGSALTTENVCEALYKQLPEWARW